MPGLFQHVDLLCGRLVNLGYQPGFFDAPEKADLSALPGRTLLHTIWGNDGAIGRVAYGLVTDGPEGVIASIRGTQCPEGTCEEWLRNFDAELAPSPLCSGTKWHEGIGKDYLGLTIEDWTPLGKALAGTILTTTGHSKGGPLALYLAGEVGAAAAVCFASPKPGDSAFCAWLNHRISTIALYANPRDVVPKTPLTIPCFEDYEFPCPLLPVDPASVLPPVGSGWGDAHNLAGCYLRVLGAE